MKPLHVKLAEQQATNKFFNNRFYFFSAESCPAGYDLGGPTTDTCKCYKIFHKSAGTPEWRFVEWFTRVSSCFHCFIDFFSVALSECFVNIYLFTSDTHQLRFPKTRGSHDIRTEANLFPYMCDHMVSSQQEAQAKTGLPGSALNHCHVPKFIYHGVWECVSRLLSENQ